MKGTEDGQAVGPPELPFVLIQECTVIRAIARTKMTMNTVADFYRTVLISKWFYFAIGATVLSYVGLNESLPGFVRDYVQFGPVIASFHIPLLRFFFLSFRYCVPLTEIAILSNEWYTPATDPQFADTLPAGTPWQHIWLQFIDDETVMIHAGRFMRQAGYADMGLADRRGNARKPNAQWDFLLLLAKKGGEISPKDGEADDRFKKRKQLLSETLQRYFRMDTDPFYPYNERKAYRIKLKLMYPQEAVLPARDDFEAAPQDDLGADIRSSYVESAPLVNDTDEMTRKWLDAAERKREGW